MFGQESGDRRKDRRRAYSFRRHFSRLKQEGRLPQVAAAAVALLILGGVTFAQCRGDSITGPSAPTTSASGSVGPAASVTTSSELPPPTTTNTMDRTAVFIGTNPCNGDLVKAEGKRHDKFSLSFSATGSHSDHHINDSFKSIEVTPAGAAAPDPDIEYVGGDVHYDKFFVDVVDGKVTHRELTNERLNRRGGGDHWVLHVLQKTVFDADQFPNGTPASVELKGHASCPDKTHCTLPDGCPDQAFSLVTPPPPAP